MADTVTVQFYLVAIEFNDANGQRWRRDERAALVPQGGRAAQAEQDIRRSAGFEVGMSMTEQSPRLMVASRPVPVQHVAGG